MIPQLFGGGAERVTAVLANEICKKTDTDVSVVVYRQSESDYPIDEKIRIYNMEKILTGSGHRIFSKIKQLRKIIFEIGPSYVISLAGPGAVALLAFSIFGTKAKLVLSERNDPRRYPEEKFLRFLRTVAYEICNGVVFQTEEAKSFFSKTIQKKSRVIKNPILCELPSCLEEEREPRIVNWCRLNSQKNLDLLIESFAKISDEFPEYTLEIYGDGPERQRLLDKIENIGLGERVFLKGHSDEVHEKVKKAALFVSSSDYEGISNSMLEALAMGIPCICTDCPAGGARETITDGVNGLLVPVNDKKRMAEAMRKVLCSIELAQKFSEKGRELREKIEAGAIAEEWLDFTDKLS